MFVTSDLFDRDIYCIKQYTDTKYKITQLSACRKKGYEDNVKHSKKNSVNEDKLMNNISRAKAIVREYVLCNPWDYWCTFTISPQKYDRHNIKQFQKDFSEFIHNQNRNREIKIKYILIPEMHKDGAWHMHGFIYGLSDSDIGLNDNGYYTWIKYNDKFGYMSLSKIKDIDRASNYALKYMTKNEEKNISELGAHLYYASQNLKKAELIYKGHGMLHCEWDWVHEEGFCRIKNVDLNKEALEEIFEVL